MTTKQEDRPCPVPDDFIRLPGLFRRWEFEQVIEGSDEFHITAAGSAEDGTELFTIYSRERPPVPGATR
jgi:hypothetical protein